MQTLDDLAPRAPRHSKAWFYYAIIAMLSVIAGFSHPAMFLFAIACALYSRYIFRGGSIVLWIW
jgi:hypothetical protein